MNNGKLIIRRLISCLILLCAACEKSHNPPAAIALKNEAAVIRAKTKKITVALAEMKKLIASGDVITRTGNDFTSQSLRSLNQRDKTYSHCGIASIEHDSLFVYHAIGGEWNPDQRLKRERFEDFANPTENVAAGIFRFDIPPQMITAVLSEVHTHYLQRLKFDLDFDLRTNDKMYCAEFIYKSFLAATDSLVSFNHSFIGDLEFIGVDDIFLDRLSTKISVLDYKIY